MIPLLTFLFVFGLFFFAFYYVLSRNPIKGVIVGLGGRFNSKGEGILSLQGRDVYFKYVPGSKNRSPELRIYIYGEYGADLLIRYETQGDRFYKQAGLNRELQIADREVNDQLYFECDDQEFLNYLFLNRNAKSKVFEILKSYSDIRISRQRCLVRKYPAPATDQINSQMLLESAKELLDLCALIPSKGGEHPELIVFKLKSFLLYVLGSITLAAGILMWIWAASSFRVADPLRLWVASCNVTILAAVTVAVAAFFIIRGFSTSSHVYVYFVCTFSLGLILLGRYGGAVYNGVYDQSEVMAFDQFVNSKYTTRSKNSITYHVVLEPWRNTLNPWSFTVSSSVYDRIQPQVTVYRVFTKKGKLNFEWVLSERLLSNADSRPVNVSQNSWPGRDYSNWYPLPLNAQGVDQEEMMYWKQWCAIIQEGITNRMNIHQALDVKRSGGYYADLEFTYVSHQQSVQEKLNALIVPDRLKAFHDTVIQAGYRQMDFYKDWASAKIADQKSPLNGSNVHLKACDQSLWDAYHQFQTLYPDRSKEFNDAIERRLAWFDIV